ncbi:GNAT family N-acetyltransferase [Actinomadura parmotrematis]|uniref:GNAT family N-acetyltransferase n=1 Tax=Actinomadura parmotrematis TaxID=2864039 RepID=A0ABS7G1E2_9ACTN|nr:GNAT family N-acetyltransferase [Actinomadura parmotrematis]MBW8486529.1 GNAT family N-acetyltransferase [Actinomadura parmotrematis]
MDIRPLTPDDSPAALDAAARAFGHPPAPHEGAVRARLSDAVAAGRQFGAFDGGRLVGTSRVYGMRQWWHGRAVSLGGVTNITVAPEERGRGVGRAVVTDALHRCAGLGHALAMLYPATTPLYRSLGWEHAGAQAQVTLRAEALRTLAAAPVPVRRAGPDDAAEVAATIARVHEEAGDAGPLDLGADAWRIALGQEGRFHYLAGDGFLSYGWADGYGPEGDGTLQVHRAVAGSQETLRALWAVVGSGSSTASTVKAVVGAHDPVLWALRERTGDTLRQERWMLRVVDVPAALSGRGYPACLETAVTLAVQDPQLPANTGTWRLTVKDGEGRVEEAGPGASAVRLTPNALAALYAGVPVTTLVRAGILDAAEAAAAAPLGAVFAADAYSLDFF